MLNKIDAISIEELDLLYKVCISLFYHFYRLQLLCRFRTLFLSGWHLAAPLQSAQTLTVLPPPSSTQWLNIDELTERMWEDLNLVRM